MENKIFNCDNSGASCRDIIVRQLALVFPLLKNFNEFAPSDVKDAFYNDVLAELDKVPSVHCVNFALLKEEWGETIEIYSDKQLVDDLLQAEVDFLEGNYFSWKPDAHTR